MVDPNEVRPSNFPDPVVLYNDGGFSIVFGTYDGIRCIGMRWNGEEGDDIGYPKLFDNPVWFALPVELSVPILKSILDIPHSNNEHILPVLGELCGR